MATSEHKPLYVWEAPVRLWHWVMAICMVVLAVTGYFIGSPLPSVSGEASDSFLLGYIRFVHFAAAYVFTIMLLVRIYWIFVGNRFAREIFVVPLAMLKPSWWAGLIDQGLYYAFLRKEARSHPGHNPLAQAAMFFMYLLGSMFMIVTGFAMYGEGTGMGSWQYALFTSWVMPLLGQSQAVHTWHHLGMWYLILFTVAHVYIVVREDIGSHETVISAMVNGWRVPKP